VRVSSADELAASRHRARRSLVEIAARNQADQHAERYERSTELIRWHDEDQATDQRDTVDESVLEHDTGNPAPL
jgi:hypothetical protein